MKSRTFAFAVLVFVLSGFGAKLMPQWTNHDNVTNLKLNFAAFLDNSSALIAGDKGTVLFTSDRGSTWGTMKLATNHSLNGISLVRVFDNEEYSGFLVGNGGKIYKRYSKRWIDISVGSDFYLKSVAFRNSVHGIAVGQKYLVLKDTYDNLASDGARASIITTVDGGKTWTENTFDVRGKFNSVVFMNKYRAIAVGDKGLFAISDDGGMTWELKNLNCYENLNKIEFCASDMGVIVGDNGAILIGSSGGAFWTNSSVKEMGICCIKSICSRDGNTLTIAGEGEPNVVQADKKITEGVIMESKNYGRTWSSVISNQKGVFNYIEFCGKTFGLAVGNGGALAVYQENRHDDPLSSGAWLNSNYPNPFNPSTKISFIIKNTENVRISILNTLGEEITVLVNELKEAGYHSVEFDASGLPSGVYFYRIQAGNFIDMKKMLLLK